MNQRFSITAFEGEEAVLTAADGSTLRLRSSLLPEGATAGQSLWLSLEEPATPQAILNELIATDKEHGSPKLA